MLSRVNHELLPAHQGRPAASLSRLVCLSYFRASDSERHVASSVFKGCESTPSPTKRYISWGGCGFRGAVIRDPWKLHFNRIAPGWTLLPRLAIPMAKECASESKQGYGTVVWAGGRGHFRFHFYFSVSFTK